jgi:hypothetical protein
VKRGTVLPASSQRAYVPWNYNPPPRFGLRLARCLNCSAEILPGDNPIVDLGVCLVKFGLCDRCLSDELEERRRFDDDFYEQIDRQVRDPNVGVVAFDVIEAGFEIHAFA